MTFYMQGLSGHERMTPGEIFKEPVALSAGLLVWMVSEWDILRHLSGVTENHQQQALHNSRGEPVNRLMKYLC